ncbi:MAG: hypothetical protein ACE5F7_06900 [Nitrospiria bacterium]
MNTEGSIDFQRSLEVRIAGIYQKIADQFSDLDEEDPEWVAFWEALAKDEKDHAAFLKIEKRFLHSGIRVEKQIAIDPEMQRELDTLITACEARIDDGITHKDAINILTLLETSEASKTFSSLLKATNSKVLNHLADFSRAHSLHEHRVREALQKYGGDFSREKIKEGRKEACDV